MLQLTKKSGLPIGLADNSFCNISSRFIPIPECSCILSDIDYWSNRSWGTTFIVGLVWKIKTWEIESVNIELNKGWPWPHVYLCTRTRVELSQNKLDVFCQPHRAQIFINDDIPLLLHYFLKNWELSTVNDMDVVKRLVSKPWLAPKTGRDNRCWIDQRETAAKQFITANNPFIFTLKTYWNLVLYTL